MSLKKILTQEELKSQIKYDPHTGSFYRIDLPLGSNANIGLITSKPTENGYIRIRILGKKYMAHRLAYLYMVGEWPDQIDHTDRNRSNNKWSNLENATDATNRKNQSLRKYNNTGHVGVTWNSKRKRYVARIGHNHKQYWLGQFKTLEEAIEARSKASSKFNFHKNHGTSLCKY